MLHHDYGPRGAEEERADFWTDIPEGADMLPGGLPGGEEDTLDTLDTDDPDGLDAPEPFNPAVVADLPIVHNGLAPDSELGDEGFDVLDQPPKAMGALGPVTDDPEGSWTGVPAQEEEAPTQDADDL